MRWAREQLSWLVSAPLLLLLLLFIVHVQCALAQHVVVETCPVNPFYALQPPTSCALGADTSNTSIFKNEDTPLKLSESACPSPISATGSSRPFSDDRTPTSTTGIAAETPADGTASVSTTSTSSPPTTSRNAKEDVWTEIDESLGQSWTAELEAEYAEAQRDFELHTQAAAESAQITSLSESGGGFDSKNAARVPEFPSFTEWKERHFAAGIHPGKDFRRDTKGDRSQKNKEDKQNNPSNTDNLTSHSEQIDGPPLASGSWNDLLEKDSTSASEDRGDDHAALTSNTQRILHPVPHAGTGDPLLDPLMSLRDRTNYASFDCSATLIRASKSTKFASAILSSKKDRYMLTPCAEKEKYVIVELCDEIQIDNIVLANLEFFSSMFKLFRVSGGTAYPDSAGTWHDIGTFRASNARGMQVFRPPEPAGGGFYRYLRIDFISHYGSEYYCPVSLLKVYGLTQLDAYRRDEERENRLATADERDLFAEMEQIPPEVVQEEPVYLQLIEPVKVDPKNQLHEPVDQYLEKETMIGEAVTEEVSEGSLNWTISEEVKQASPESSRSITVPPSYSSSTSSRSDSNSGTLDSAVTSRASMSGHTDASLSSSSATQGQSPRQSVKEAKPSASPSTRNSTADTTPSESASASISHSPTAATAPTRTSASVVASHAGLPGGNGTSIILNRPSQTSTKSSSGRSSTPSTSVPRSSSKITGSSPSLTYRTVSNGPQQATASPARRNDSKPQVIYTHGHHSSHQPNESIYGTIMKRLLALEVNSTLSTTYLEEQSRMVWETFRRIEDRLSTMEKTRSKYDQLLRRVMLDLELHRARHEAERTELGGQLGVLSKEMVMEKRLGIAQLIALIVLMFFVVLTRGSPSSPILNLAHPRSAANDTAFPAAVRSRRPRSLRDEPFDSYPTTDFRSLPSRDKRGVGSGSRGGIYANGSGLSRNTSVKRPYRNSNNMTKRPLVVLPLRKNGFDYSSNTPDILSPLSGQPLSPLSSSAPSDSFIQTLASKRSSRAASPANGVDSPALGMSDIDLSASTITLRSSTPPLYPVPPKARRSPVETLRRKLKLMQPRRATSMDETDTVKLPNDVAATNDTPALSSSSMPDRRKRFSLGTVSHLRSRSDTLSSMASEGDEGNSKAWLSTSEDSGDDNGNSTTPSIGSPSFSDFAKHSVQNSPSRYIPPSPDPSDAETPAAHNQDLPSTSPRTNGST